MHSIINNKRQPKSMKSFLTQAQSTLVNNNETISKNKKAEDL